MYKDLKFPILIVHRAIKADSVAGERVRGIAEELRQDGFAILAAADKAEARLVAATHHGLACMLIAAEGIGDNTHLLQNMAELIRLARQRAPDLPIFALGEQVTLENAPAEAMSELNQLRGILYLFEDTVPLSIVLASPFGALPPKEVPSPCKKLPMSSAPSWARDSIMTFVSLRV
jgi:arginine decarboxylase